MDTVQSLIVPPRVEENNYAYWRVRMRVFRKSLDEWVWTSIKKGSTKPEINVEKWSKD